MRKNIWLLLSITFFMILMVACSSSNQSSSSSNGSSGDSKESESSSSGSDYPNREITFIVPYAAGGGSDLSVRAIAAAAEKQLGVPIGVVNKPGGNASIGMSEAANSKPDGYTLVMNSVEGTTLPHLGLSPFTYKDFKHIMQFNLDPSALTVKTDGPFKTLDDLLEHAKKNSGEIRVGGSGTGGIWHLGASLIEKETGVKFTYVPFDGAAPAATALLGGHIDAVTVSPAEVLTHVRAGTLTTLAVVSQERSPALPDVPTFQELGYDISAGAWRGIDVHKDTPDEIVAILEEAFLKATEDPEFISFMEENGLGIAKKNSQDYSKLMEEEHNLYGELLKELGMVK